MMTSIQYQQEGWKTGRGDATIWRIINGVTNGGLRRFEGRRSEENRDSEQEMRGRQELAVLLAQALGNGGLSRVLLIDTTDTQMLESHTPGST